MGSAGDKEETAGTAAGVESAPEKEFTSDRDSRTRRIFAQEFVTQLKRLGSGSAEDLQADGIAFFSAKPTRTEIDDVGRIAQRYGWAEQEDEVWSVTDAGAALPRPPSLGLGQVLTRVLQVANPVRTNAQDWIPRIALVAGATAGAASIRNVNTRDVIRALALAVLAISIAVQFHGEYRIT
jgi:hypothetical protein